MDDKIKITFSIIAHNEEKNIQRCLKSIQWADEIIVVDCESTDKTVAIARKFTKKIFKRKNLSNLNVNKSFGISKATNEWIFYLDPDEVITKSLKNEIISVVNTDSNYQAFKIPRANYYIFDFLKHGGNYPDYQLRLFKKGYASFPNQHVHEKLKVKGRVGTLRAEMQHFPYSSIKEYVQKMNFYTGFQAEYNYKQNKSMSLVKLLYVILIKSNIKFAKRYVLKLGFFDGIAGLFSAITNSLTMIISSFKLYEKNQDF